MIKKILVSLLALIVALLIIGCGKDVFDRDDVKIKPLSYTVVKGDTLEEIYGAFYEHNTVFVNWEEYRQKHRELNAMLTANGRALQPNDLVVGFSVHKKGELK